jgi:hypothetical protein
LTSLAASSLQPSVDVDQASHHLEVLHAKAAGFGSLILLGNGRRERHCFFHAAELRDDPSSLDSSREALQDVVDNRWNVYASMATFTQTPDRGRGTRADVDTVPGVWADVDVKPDVEDYFADEDDVRAYVAVLPPPTLEIASGSGGRHLYWLTHERLEPRVGADTLLAWLDFLRDAARGRTIENVHDTTRILRLAGTVRWPKVADPVAPLPAKVDIVREGPRYHLEELTTLSAPAHRAASLARKEAHARYTEEHNRQQWNIERRGLEAKTFQHIVLAFNAAQDWEPLLTATGWTLHSDERGGVARCRFWTRPGKKTSDGKSASTDFTHEEYADSHGVKYERRVSQMMSIYTKDPSLQPLWENAHTYDDVGLVSKWKFATTCLGVSDTALLHAVRKTGTLP